MKTKESNVKQNKDSKHLIRGSALLSGGLMSLCCGVPLVIAILGATGIGFLNKFLGEYHWFILFSASAIIAGSWYFYINERKRCTVENGHCKIDVNSTSNKITKYVLMLSTLVVITFALLNIYSFIKHGDNKLFYAQRTGVISEFNVMGMTCASCEMYIESTVKKLHGVYKVKASTKKKSVIIDYDDKTLTKKRLIEAINLTGYRVII